MESSDVRDWIGYDPATRCDEAPVEFSVSISMGGAAGTVLSGTVLLDREHEAASFQELQRAADAIFQLTNGTLRKVSTSAPVLEIDHMARNVRAHDFAGNLDLLGDYLDRLLPRWSQKVPSMALAPYEDALMSIATDEGPDCARAMSATVLRRRRQRRADMNRYECQVHCERLLVMLHGLVTPRIAERDRTMATLLNEIERSPMDYLTVGRAASYLALSESHFARQFKQHTSQNYNHYVTCKRLDRAKLMLEHTDKPVRRIATELDFQPVNYFSRTFKKHVGITPSQYRQERARGTS